MDFEQINQKIISLKKQLNRAQATLYNKTHPEKLRAAVKKNYDKNKSENNEIYQKKLADMRARRLRIKLEKEEKKSQEEEKRKLKCEVSRKRYRSSKLKHEVEPVFNSENLDDMELSAREITHN